MVCTHFMSFWLRGSLILMAKIIGIENRIIKAAKSILRVSPMPLSMLGFQQAFKTFESGTLGALKALEERRENILS